MHNTLHISLIIYIMYVLDSNVYTIKHRPIWYTKEKGKDSEISHEIVHGWNIFKCKKSIMLWSFLINVKLK